MSFDELCAAGGEIAPHLPPPERLLLWAIRAWSAHHTDISGVWWHLDRAFSQAGIRAALEPFDSMMCMIFGGLRRWPDIRCVRCPRVGEDEARVLALVACVQSGQQQEGHLLLKTLVASPAARKTCSYAEQVARTLDSAGLRLTTLPRKATSVTPMKSPVASVPMH